MCDWLQKTSHQRPGEFELIRKYFAPLASDPGSLGLTDDAAVYRPKTGNELVVTKDMLAADVHFFADDPPEAIAAKALRVNLSDLAAKGAKPVAYLLGLALQKDWNEKWIERFCNGLSADQSAFDVALAGGDTIRSGNGLVISVTAFGETPFGAAVRRNGASPGDLLYVTGTIGDAAAGLKERLVPGFCRKLGLSQEDERHVLDRYLLPRPRVSLAGAVRQYASAAMDVSDGLLADALHIAKASGVVVELDMEAVPLSPAMKAISSADPQMFRTCLNGGDDYEILAAVPKSDQAEFEQRALSLNCPVTQIGEAYTGHGSVRLKSSSGIVDLEDMSGFRHF